MDVSVAEALVVRIDESETIAPVVNGPGRDLQKGSGTAVRGGKMCFCCSAAGVVNRAV